MFTETSPALYKTMDPFSVTMNADGTLTLAEKDKARTDVSVSESTITAKNTPINAKMTLTKVDASDTSKKIPGVAFTLSGPTFNGGKPLTLTTDADGAISCDNLPKGDYTLAETTANANYENGGFNATFSVTDACQDKTLTIDTNGDTNNAKLFQLSITADSGHVTENGLQNERQTGTVNVEKLGVDKKALKGATFEVHKTDGTLVGTAGVTDAGGKVSFSGLAWGNYYLVETAVPAGYQVDSTHHDFTIGYDNLTKNFTDASAITNTENSFTLTKNPAGATFTVTGELADGTGSVTLKGATSYTETGLLVGGKIYTVTETVPPAGYKVVAPFQVTMATDGTLSSSNLPVGVTLKDNVITVTDPQNTFKLTKEGENSQSLDGTRFELHTYDMAATLIDSWTLEKGETSHDFTGVMVAGTVYSLFETTPAPGYTSAATVFLKMDNDGTLEQSANGTDGWSAVGNNLLTISDELNSVGIAKFDANGTTRLGGAQFTISGDFARTAEKSISWTSDATNAESLTGELIAGNSYKLVESAPAPGHVLSPWTATYADAALDNGALVIEADQSGQLYYQSTNLAGWTALTGNAIAMKDEQNSISIAKVDATDPAKLLDGAHLTLSGFFADGSGVESVFWTSSATEAKDFTGELIAGNVYKLTEDTPPSGYVTAPAVYLKVDETGALWTCSTPDGTFTTSPNDYVLDDVQNSFELRKVDDSGEPLTGATFKVEGALADETTELPLDSGAATTDLTGKLVAGNTYTVIETLPPAGFKAIDPFALTVSADGSKLEVSPAPGSTELPAGVSVSDNGISVTVADGPVAVTFTKTDRTTGDQLANHKDCIFRVRPVSDGTFADGKTTQVEGYDDQITTDLRGQFIVTEVTKDAQGNYQITGTPHVYSIQEIQEPGGYQIEPDAVQFIVDQNGDVHVLNGEGTIVTSADGTADLSFSDPTIKVSFAKTDTSGTALAGASFELDGTFVASDGTNTTTPITWTSTTGLETVDAKLIAGDTYTLTETSAPSGYDAISGSVTFTVDSLGNVTLTGDAGGAATLSGAASDTVGMVISVADSATPTVPVTHVSASIPKTADAAPAWPLPVALLGCVLVVCGWRRRRKSVTH